MAKICAQFDVTPQAHYQKYQREEKRLVENAILLELVRQVKRKHPKMGGRKVLYKIQPILEVEGMQMGRDRLFELLRSQNLLVKPQKTYRRTTIPGLWRAPNRLPGLVISQPNQVWVCDITYLEMGSDHFAYLFILMDLFARYILGWHVAPSLASKGALASLGMALQVLSPIPQGLIHHSDHGVQYTSRAYMNALLEHHILPSMGTVGNCYDNIFAERVIGILKNEYALRTSFNNLTQVNQAVKEVIHLYNTDRPHLSLNMATPQNVYWGKCRNVPSLEIPEVSEINSDVSLKL